VALDIERFKSDLRRLLRGEEVELPRYDFESGKSNPHSGVEMSLNPGEVLIIEGIHALSPELTGGIKSFLGGRRIYPVRIFVDAPPDLRLGRRMVRDWQTRGHSPYDTLRQWENVRYGEDNYIYPTMQYADVVIDTTISQERFISSPLYPKLREALQIALSDAEIMEDAPIIEWIENLQKEYFGPASTPKPGP
jgi:uridine kinase